MEVAGPQQHGAVMAPGCLAGSKQCELWVDLDRNQTTGVFGFFSSPFQTDKHLSNLAARGERLSKQHSGPHCDPEQVSDAGPRRPRLCTGSGLAPTVCCESHSPDCGSKTISRHSPAGPLLSSCQRYITPFIYTHCTMVVQPGTSLGREF